MWQPPPPSPWRTVGLSGTGSQHLLESACRDANFQSEVSDVRETAAIQVNKTCSILLEPILPACAARPSLSLKGPGRLESPLRSTARASLGTEKIRGAWELAPLEIFLPTSHHSLTQALIPGVLYEGEKESGGMLLRSPLWLIQSLRDC